VSKACPLFLVFPGTSSTPLLPPSSVGVGIVPQVPTASALPHTWTLKWVYKELGSATLDETLRGQEMQRMVGVDVPMPAPAQTPNALTSNVFGAA